jgi:hypothetical protein
MNFEQGPPPLQRRSRKARSSANAGMEQRGRPTRQPRADRDRQRRLGHFLHLSRRQGDISRGPDIAIRASGLVRGSADRPTQRWKAPRAWFDALDLPVQQRICRQMQKQFWQNPSYVRATTCGSSRYIRALGSVKAFDDDSCTKPSRTTAAPTAIIEATRHAAMKTRMIFLRFPTTIYNACPETGSVKASVSIATKVRPTAPTHA